MLQSSSLDLFHRRKAILRNGDVNGIEALKSLWKVPASPLDIHI